MTMLSKKTTESGGMDELPAALDLALFEQAGEGRFQPLGMLPDWLPLPAEALSDRQGIDLAEHFPVLELFASDCEGVWNTGEPSRIKSDVWTEDLGGGRQHFLQAIATRVGGRRLMAIVSLPQELFTYQQLAHDVELEKEKVERLSRELEVRRAEAERATAAKSAFLATMSHEIRTPLNAIIGMADVLSATSLTAAQQKCVDVFQRNGVSLLNLINDILDLSKVESGAMELETAPMDLREVIGAAVEVAEVRATAKGLELRPVIAPGTPYYLIGDPNRLRQVIVNLLGNAIKFTERGHVEVRVEPDPEDRRPGQLRFSVTDTGIGIPEDKLDTVFESFKQADNSTTRKYGGTGLGLSISRQIVGLMGGRLAVQSRVGAGSVFYFSAGLGVQQDQSERAPAQQAQSSIAELERKLDGLRILLADDAEDNRFLIKSYLQGVRCSIDIAEDGAAAERMFRAGRYDVVLMDVEMPVADGYTATRAIRRYEHETGAPPTPVLALTAHAFADMAAKSLEAGFTAHLTKPIRKLTLMEALASLGATGRVGAPIIAETPAPSTAPLTAGGRILIRVEKDMEDVVPDYLEKRRKDIPTYRKALANQDLETVRMMGHKMKGTGAAYGFDRMTELGAAIEEAALRGDADRAAAAVEELDRYVDCVELEYIR